MGDPLAAALIVIGVLVAAAAVIASVNRSSAYAEIGKRRLLEEEGTEEQQRRQRELEDQELIALWEAKNKRRRERGEAEVDLAEELRRLTSPEGWDRL